MKVTVLGCGGSGGVPLVGCRCAVCTSSDPRNRRTRASIAVEDGVRVLVDTAPDLRQQFLATGLSKFDAVILTHSHADHLHGIDELRSVNYAINAPLEVWAEATTLAEARVRFGYAFAPPASNYGRWYSPSLVAREIVGRFSIGDLEIDTFRQLHGGDRHPTLGLRFGKFAYSTDAHELPETAFGALAGVEVWIVDCLQERPNPAHSHLAQTLEWIARVRPQRAILTHMNHTLDHAELAAKLPAGVEPAYDGMVIEI
ncbi:MAG: MBL fold metallo-hydrolase [Pseudomonadota bacterium]